jgi:hypothetical protein
LKTRQEYGARLAGQPVVFFLFQVQERFVESESFPLPVCELVNIPDLRPVVISNRNRQLFAPQSVEVLETFPEPK